MNNKWLDFKNGNISAVKVETVISRETTTKGMQFIHVLIDGDEVYNFWHNPSNVKAKRDKEPKHTGGKKPYIMLMIERVEELRSQGIDNIEELIGFLVCLGNNIEWNTGRLINKRNKKSLRYADLQEIFTCGKRKLDRIISDLKKHSLVSNNQDGYFISDSIIKKGSKKE